VTSRRLIGPSELTALLADLPQSCSHGGRLFVLGDTSHLLEGWHPWVSSILLATESGSGGTAIGDAVRVLAARHEIPTVVESPADIVPLPADFERRHRSTAHQWETPGGKLEILHYDPYSVVCRGIVRGDEPDYQTAIRYLQHGWVTVERMTELYDALLPQFTTATIAQDAAEFRRKYKGLLQMWRSRVPQ